MSVEIHCSNPSCKRPYKVPADKVGKSLKCKACGETFIASSAKTQADDFMEPAWGDAKPVAASATATIPTAIGRFAIRGKLGAGAFGTVYRAYDPQLDRVVALKVPNPGVMTDAKRAERFLREAKAAANLHHPHIVPVFDAGKDGDSLYIASAFIGGKPLADSIPDGGTEFARAARLVRELAEALAYAHEQGIVHRDVKPANVMLDTLDRVHLMDFGLASRQEEAGRLTSDGAVMGTPAYMSPEQARGQHGDAQPATDQYAAGVVLYELLTGRTPFGGPPAVVIAAVISTEPEPPHKVRSDVPKDLETICLKAMSKKPEDRYANCQALADDLRRWSEGEPVSARPLGFTERGVRWLKKEPKLVAAVAVVALALLVSVLVVSGAARRAEKDAAEARAAGQRAEEALSEARRAREREEQAAGTTLGALGTAAEERQKAEGFRARAEELRSQAETLRTQVAALKNQADASRAEVEPLRTQAKEKADQAAVAEAKAQSLLAEVAPREEVIKSFQYGERCQFAQAHLYAGLSASARQLLAGIAATERGWEWEFLNRMSLGAPGDPPLTTLGHDGPVAFAASSPDNRRVVTVGTDGTANVWPSTGGKPIALNGHRGRVRAAAFSPDSKKLLTVGADGVALVWSNGFVQSVTLAGPTRRVTAAAFAPDSVQIATVESDGTVRVWGEFGNELYVLRCPTDVHTVAFSPDGSQLLVAGGTAAVWEVKTKTERYALKSARTVVFAAFSPDGSKVVTAAADAATVWNAKTGAEDCVCKHANVRSAAFTLDGTRLFTSGAGGKLWDTGTGAELATGSNPAALSPDGKRFVTTGSDPGSRSITIWDAKTGVSLLSYAGDVVGGNSVAFSPDGSDLISYGSRVKVWHGGRTRR